MSDQRKSLQRYRCLVALPAATLVVGTMLASSQVAQAVTWTGAVDASMNTAGNWDGPVNVNGVLIDIGAAGASNALTVNASFQGAGGGIGNMTIARPAGLSINNIGAANIVGLRFAGNAGLTINAGTGAVNFGGASNAYLINMGTGTSNYINNSATTANINSNVQLNASGGTLPVVAFGGTGAWNFAGTTSATIQGLVKNGSADLTLGGSNAHIGETIVNSGTLTITNSNALGSSLLANDTHIVGSNGTTGTTLILSGAALTIAEALNFNANAAGRAGMTNNNAFNQVLNGPIDVSSTGNLVQWNSSGTGSITINGDITGSMTGGSLLFLRGGSTSTNNRILGSLNLTGGNLAKTDDGLWVIGNAGETYSWNDTQMARGTLRLNLANMLPAATNVIVGQGTDASAATLDLFGFSQTIGGLSKLGTGTNKQITNSSGTAATLTVNNTVNSTYDGRINGNLALTKNGVGVLALTDANGYTGTTRIQQGTLLISNAGALGTTAGGTTIVGNTTGSGILELTNSIAIGAEVFTLEARQAATVNIPHIRNVSGNNSIAGNITLTTGGSDYNLESVAGQLTLNGTVTNVNTGTRRLKLFGAGNGIINGDINVNAAGDNEIVKSGTGTWTINNAVNLNELFVNQGTLNVNGTVGGTTTVASGATLAGEGDLGAATAAAGSIVAPGIGLGDIGTLGFASLDLNGTLLIDINGAGLGSADLLNVSGVLDISGAILDLDLAGVLNDPFYIFASYGSLTGTFANVTGLTAGGYEIKYNFQGNNIALVAIPEPATMSLLALGGLGLLRRRQSVR